MKPEEPDNPKQEPRDRIDSGQDTCKDCGAEVAHYDGLPESDYYVKCLNSGCPNSVGVHVSDDGCPKWILHRRTQEAP